MAHLINDHKLPGIGPGRIKRLRAAGFESLESLVEAGAETIGAIPHIPPDVAARAVEAAAALLSDLVEETTPIEEAPVEAAPVEEAPVQEAPVEEAPVEAAPVEAAPVEAAPAKEAPVEAAPAEEAAPAPEPAPDVSGEEPVGPLGRSKRLLGQLDETLQRLLPGPWGRIRETARRLRG